MQRRDFLKATLATTAAMAIPTMGRGEQPVATSTQGSKAMTSIPRRPYGKEGIRLSVIGFGGIVVMSAQQDHANHVVAEAADRGINYFDVAPSYGDAELRLGPALRPYRKNVFLACKTIERTAEGARKEFEASLEHLYTDHFDVYQLHGLTDVKKGVDTAFAKGGVMEFLIEQKKLGRVRHLGFSAHSAAAAIAAMDRYDFDSCLVPVNFATWYKGHFEPEIVAHAKAKGLSILALKSMARQKWPENDPLSKQYAKCWYQPLTDPQQIGLALRFTLAQGVTALLPPGEESLWRLALENLGDAKPLSAAEQAELRTLAEAQTPIFQAA